MRQRIIHGTTIDFVTPNEVNSMLDTIRPPECTRIRAGETIALDGSGDGQDEVYTVPIGFEFSLRRLWVNISTARDPVTGAVPLNVAGRYVAILRSGALVEYPVLVSPTGLAQVPGITTWSDSEEPHYRNGEVVEIQAVGLTPTARLIVLIDGKLTKGRYGD